MAQISKDVPTEVLQGAVLAVQDLRRKYQGEDWVNYEEGDWGCPLCSFTGYEEVDAVAKSTCVNCPHVFIDNPNFDFEYFFDVPCHSIQTDYRLQSLEQKFSRIDRWEDAITEELAARRVAR